MYPVRDLDEGCRIPGRKVPLQGTCRGATNLFVGGADGGFLRGTEQQDDTWRSPPQLVAGHNVRGRFSK